MRRIKIGRRMGTREDGEGRGNVTERRRRRRRGRTRGRGKNKKKERASVRPTFNGELWSEIVVFVPRRGVP